MESPIEPNQGDQDANGDVRAPEHSRLFKAISAGGWFAILCAGCAVPPPPTYRVDPALAIPWTRPENPVACPVTDSVDVVVEKRVVERAMDLREGHKGGGARVVWTKEGAVGDSLVPPGWKLQEFYTHDDCLPRSLPTARLVLSTNGHRTDSVQLAMADTLVYRFLEWTRRQGGDASDDSEGESDSPEPLRKAMVRSAKRMKVEWSLSRIDGQCAKGWVEKILLSMRDEIDRRRRGETDRSEDLMSSQERNDQFQTRLQGRSRNPSVTLVRNFRETPFAVTIQPFPPRFGGIEILPVEKWTVVTGCPE